MMQIAVRRATLLAVLAMFAFALPPYQGGFAQEKIVLRTDFPPVPIHAGLFLAQVNGWFKHLNSFHTDVLQERRSRCRLSYGAQHRR